MSNLIKIIKRAKKEVSKQINRQRHNFQLRNEQNNKLKQRHDYEESKN